MAPREIGFRQNRPSAPIPKTMPGKSRTATTILSVLFGAALLAGGWILGSWGQGKASIHIKLIKFASDNAITTSASTIDPANDDRLVFLTGQLSTANGVFDEEIGFQQTAIRLSRRVEMFQWEQTTRRVNSRHRYEYRKVWSDEIIDSRDFRRKSGHENPATLPFNSASFEANDIKLGAYDISATLIEDSIKEERVAFTEAMFAELPDETRSQYRVKSPYLTTARGDHPEIGDIRVSYRIVAAAEISVFAQQNESALTSFPTQHGPLVWVEQGVHDMQELLDGAETMNSQLGQILAGISVIIMIIGAAFLMRPIGLFERTTAYIRKAFGFGIVAIIGLALLSVAALFFWMLAMIPGALIVFFAVLMLIILSTGFSVWRAL